MFVFDSGLDSQDFFDTIASQYNNFSGNSGNAEVLANSMIDMLSSGLDKFASNSTRKTK